MTAVQFDQFWLSRFPHTPPISHYFRHDYGDKWFRIHSLPESKRYANTEAEWETLLTRQNAVITDVLGLDTSILLVTGDYLYDELSAEEVDFTLDSVLTLESIAGLPFEPATRTDLHRMDPEEYDSGRIYQPFFCEQIWRPHQFDAVLKDIADDCTRVLFIALERECIAVPYDGGVDLFLPTAEARDTYRTKYQAWLSSREDGL
ncbi:hypothetical protein Q5H92_18900 [Hymenobacter sp. M29]|uniref:DUF3885 domain-containing protein n=1 Tax=Hymenobacter mellowenesis TaxID=3063995 RepID=A0ABT9AEZ7_9BACT|nr:hypothetical protein [Hymenobacter sp. M29]MDO7848442.1 hypothetical protein [Hymenobacter sp. M29]